MAEEKKNKQHGKYQISLQKLNKLIENYAEKQEKIKINQVE